MSKRKPHPDEVWDKFLNFVYPSDQRFSEKELTEEMSSARVGFLKAKQAVQKHIRPAKGDSHIELYPHTTSNIQWTNKSVQKLAGNRDPVSTLIDQIRMKILSAIDAGWLGPPFDPLQLAKILQLQSIPNSDIDDARIVPIHGPALRIEYNPNRPAARVRYSIAHEIAHFFFPDCAEQVRNRARKLAMSEDEWQLEMLCNLGAAEILMPIGSFPALESENLTVDKLLELRQKFQVSTEAIFLRAVRLTDVPCMAFAASRDERNAKIQYQVEYSYRSRSWRFGMPPINFDSNSAIAACTAVGFTNKQDLVIEDGVKAQVECVGIPPYPGRSYPRVVGLIRAAKSSGSAAKTWSIKYVTGDATKPHGKKPYVIAHIVNDKTANWGGGFALFVRKKWPEVQDDFKTWVSEDPARLMLGKTHLFKLNDDTWMFHMISQHGYGQSGAPGIRYHALKNCLAILADMSQELGASVHMPRIGSGEARGKWEVIEELIAETLGGKSLSVTVYTPPNGKIPIPKESEKELF